MTNLAALAGLMMMMVGQTAGRRQHNVFKIFCETHFDLAAIAKFLRAGLLWEKSEGSGNSEKCTREPIL